MSWRLSDAIQQEIAKNIINNIRSLQGKVWIFSGSTQYKMSSVFYRQLQCGALSDGFLQGFHGYLLQIVLLEFLVVAVVAVASHFASSHRI